MTMATVMAIVIMGMMEELTLKKTMSMMETIGYDD